MHLHIGFHKSLTVLVQRVAEVTSAIALWEPFKYIHFHSFREEALGAAVALSGRNRPRYIVGLNNHFVSAEELAERNLEGSLSVVTRLPSDLLVSGYRYHKRAAEPWTKDRPFNSRSMSEVNLNIPAALGDGQSVSEFLLRNDEETGLLFELELREQHFLALNRWKQDERATFFAYEAILGNESEFFRQLFASWGLCRRTQLVGASVARYFSSNFVKARSSHVSGSTAKATIELPSSVKAKLGDLCPDWGNL